MISERIKEIRETFINSTRLDFPESDLLWLIETCDKLEKGLSEMINVPEVSLYVREVLGLTDV